MGKQSSVRRQECGRKFLKDRDALVEKYSDGIRKDLVTEDNEYEFDKDCYDLEKDFLRAILEDYRINLNKDYDFRNSDKYVIEAIEANEYEFTQDGKIFH